MDRTTVDVGALLDDIAMHLPESWRRPDVELRLEVALGLPRIERDSGKLKTVVRNLVHNPYEFTERGRVTLGARAGVGGAVEITVADTGRGIPPEAIDRVFEMFQQVPGSGGGGVGLGLHIVRRFVDVLGGTVAVSSEVGRGTCFVVTLPRSGAPAAGGARGVARLKAREGLAGRVGGHCGGRNGAGRLLSSSHALPLHGKPAAVRRLAPTRAVCGAMVPEPVFGASLTRGGAAGERR